jgi:hypothetical protein
MGRWVDLIGPGSGWAIFWPAHSKLGVEAWASSEGSGLMSSRVGFLGNEAKRVIFVG